MEEIEDDVDDIEEDESIQLNGNRFLEILNSKDTEKFEEYVTLVDIFRDTFPELVKRIREKINKLRQ